MPATCWAPASIRLTCREGDETRTIVFSGDIGNADQPIIRDPPVLRQGRLCPHGVHLRRPQPHRGLELHR